MKFLLFSLPFLIFISCTKVNDASTSYHVEIETLRDKKDKEFKTAKSSPLLEEDKAKFDSLEYYPIDEKYKIEANFIRTSFDESFIMPATGESADKYVRFGIAKFELDGNPVQLNVYQNLSQQMKDGEVHLFVPFTDATSGEATYGGGRYLDPVVPEGETILLDFNRSYNPYCVYNSKFSCPLPPRDNWLEIPIEAGEKYFEASENKDKKVNNL